MATFGSRLKLLRLHKGITQEDLAEILNTTKQNIYKYENDIITNVPTDKIQKLANYFNVTPSYLVGWESKEDSDKFIAYKSLIGTSAYKKLKATDEQLKNTPMQLLLKIAEIAENLAINNQPQDEDKRFLAVVEHMFNQWEENKHDLIIYDILYIAEYLNHSLDYLFDRTTLEEEQLVKAYRSAPEMQEAVKKLLGIE